ncbi:hypothetical protein HET69_19125 [Streptomyces sp. CJ_13]|uniref:hypothetical protein n=1 Tax=Streptomyces sp. CJ_13 TaxID=2724943 RepID=UPI001BDDA675|nr:hypothetical protein [Streptomyces sp. CJ_13]MBT1186057.1 hypothetical protein [Streptomyces sp. CJ_13]
MTTDPDTAWEWLEGWTVVSGVEGLVVKVLDQRYRPGARDSPGPRSAAGAPPKDHRHPQRGDASAWTGKNDG